MHISDTGARPMPRPAARPDPATGGRAASGFLNLPSLEALLDWLETRQ